jgi:hypothetical protein
MALNKARLSQKIYENLITFWNPSELYPLEGSQAGNRDLTARKMQRHLADSIAKAVVEEITESAVVQTTTGAPDGEHTGRVY